MTNIYEKVVPRIKYIPDSDSETDDDKDNTSKK